MTLADGAGVAVWASTRHVSTTARVMGAILVLLRPHLHGHDREHERQREIVETRDGRRGDFARLKVVVHTVRDVAERAAAADAAQFDLRGAGPVVYRHLKLR